MFQLLHTIVRTGFEPVLPPWKGGVLTPWPTDQSCYFQLLLLYRLFLTCQHLFKTFFHQSLKTTSKSLRRDLRPLKRSSVNFFFSWFYIFGFFIVFIVILLKYHFILRLGFYSIKLHLLFLEYFLMLPENFTLSYFILIYNLILPIRVTI